MSKRKTGNLPKRRTAPEPTKKQINKAPILAGASLVVAFLLFFIPISIHSRPFGLSELIADHVHPDAIEYIDLAAAAYDDHAHTITDRDTIDYVMGYLNDVTISKYVIRPSVLDDEPSETYVVTLTDIDGGQITIELFKGALLVDEGVYRVNSPNTFIELHTMLH